MWITDLLFSVITVFKILHFFSQPRTFKNIYPQCQKAPNDPIKISRKMPLVLPV